MDIQTEEVILNSSGARQTSRLRTICEIFRYQAENIEQFPLGHLFIVTQLSLVKDCGHLNNLLASIIKREYYAHPQKDFSKSFQKALNKANAHLKEVFKQGSQEWLGKLHFICAVISQDHILFAQAGEAQAFLWREGRLIDLSHKIIPEAKRPSPNKIFSSLVSGKLQIDDKIIFATPSLHEIFSATALRQILAISDPADMADQINKASREQQKIIPLGILLLKTSKDSDEIKIPSKIEKPKTITPPIDLNEILKYKS